MDDTRNAESMASGTGGEQPAQHGTDSTKSYVRFAAMIITSTIVMYGVMYLHTYQWSHVEFSETRAYMALVMGWTMTVIMLSFMWAMHPDRRLNVGIYVAAAVVFVGSLWLVRSQVTVDDRSYMRSMMPHHSIAVLASERADIDDVRVREVADEIIASQCREIAEMQWLIEDIGENGLAEDPEAAAARAVPEFDEQC